MTLRKGITKELQKKGTLGIRTALESTIIAIISKGFIRWKTELAANAVEIELCS